MLKLILSCLTFAGIMLHAIWLFRKPKTPLADVPRVWLREMVKVSGLALVCVVACAAPIALILFLIVNVR